MNNQPVDQLLKQETALTTFTYFIYFCLFVGIVFAIYALKHTVYRMVVEHFGHGSDISKW